jgi:hypothetical protein
VLLVAVVGILHRAILFWLLRPALIDLVAQKPDYVTMQLLPFADYRAHFWRSLWLLQQSPPVGHIVMKAVVTLTSDPGGVAQILCVLNGLLSIAAACLLCGMIRYVTASRAAAIGLSLWFLLSTDCVVMEYALFGQVFYEFLAMLLVTGCGALLLGMEPTGGAVPRRAAALGALAAIGALTRSSLCYLPLAIGGFGLIRFRLRVLAWFVAPVLLLQGFWAAKNAVEYGRFTLETSSWGGFNAERGLVWDGQQRALCDAIVASTGGTYPDWFVAMNRDCPLPFADISESYVPPEVQARDRAAGESLGGAAPVWNSRAIAEKSALYHKAIIRFLLAHPAVAWRSFQIGYGLFWQRIGDYAGMFFGPFTVAGIDRGFPGLLSRGFAEQQRVMLRIDQGGRGLYRSAWLPTLSLAPLDALSILALHLLLPGLALADLWRRAHRRACGLPRGTAALALLALYGLVLFSAVDVGENMRFRLAIEPVIIALTASCLAGMIRLARPRPPHPTLSPQNVGGEGFSGALPGR